MAELKNIGSNLVPSGRVGNQLVFRNRNGRLFICKRPAKTKKKPTEAQVAQRERFADAVIYAKAAIKDPVLKDIYAAMAGPFQSAFNVATMDFSAGPEIKEINTTEYNGSTGSRITVKAVDNCKVAKVNIKITSAAGILIEKGEATQLADSIDWEFTVLNSNTSCKGSLIIVTAYDLAGNTCTSEKLLQ